MLTSTNLDTPAYAPHVPQHAETRAGLMERLRRMLWPRSSRFKAMAAQQNAALDATQSASKSRTGPSTFDAPAMSSAPSTRSSPTHNVKTRATLSPEAPEQGGPAFVFGDFAAEYLEVHGWGPLLIDLVLKAISLANGDPGQLVVELEPDFGAHAHLIAHLLVLDGETRDFYF